MEIKPSNFVLRNQNLDFLSNPPPVHFLQPLHPHPTRKAHIRYPHFYFKYFIFIDYAHSSLYFQTQ